MSNNIRNFKELMIGNKEKNIKPMTIEIPMLQRDYAQGREETKTTQIRERFLTSIFEVLSGEKANLHLEFIYGSVKNGKFIPLDGQQRLTTLFLLHWYFGFGELKDGEKSNILKDGEKSKFRYETRASSREFCDMLVNLSTKELEEALEAELKDLKTKKEKHEKDLKNKEESLKKLEERKTLEKKIKELKEKIAELEKEIKEKSKISYYIKNRAEFLPFWEKDPTVKSMLNMLDAIHEKAKDKNLDNDKAKAKENLDKIDFDFLNMGEFGLSDELYIKMNARGKRLTEFENFKAKFEDLLEKEKFRHLLRYFKNKIDKDWADKFWEFRDKNEKENPADSADKAFMNYFYFISEMLFYKEKEKFKSKIKEKEDEIFKDFKNKNEKEKDEHLMHYFKYKFERDWAKRFWNFKKQNPEKRVKEPFDIFFNNEMEYKDKKTDKIDINKALKVYEKQENIVFLFRALNNINQIKEYANKIFSQNSEENKICIFDKFKENFLDELFQNKKDESKKDENLHQKILLFTVIYGINENINDDKLKDILRLVRNISNSAKYHSDGKLDYAPNFRTSAFGWVINEIIYKFKKVDYAIRTENSPSEITNEMIEHENIKLRLFANEAYKKAIIEFENHKYLKGDLRNFIDENTSFEDFQKSKEAIEEIFELDDYKIASLLLCFKKEKEKIEEFSIQNFYPYRVGRSSGYPKYHFGKKDYWEIILTNKDNKVIFKNLIKEFTNQNSIEKIINNFKNNLITKNWLYYFLQYNEIFFGEIENLDIKDEFSNVFNWDTCKDEEIKGYDIEKMSGSRISNKHINPYLYTALKDKENVEFKDTKENSSSYGKIENFIEKLYCLDDGWHIEFVGNFDFSAIKDKLKPSENPNEFILAHDPDSDTIENLQNLLKNLAQI